MDATLFSYRITACETTYLERKSLKFITFYEAGKDIKEKRGHLNPREMGDLLWKRSGL